MQAVGYSHMHVGKSQPHCLFVLVPLQGPSCQVAQPPVSGSLTPVSTRDAFIAAMNPLALPVPHDVLRVADRSRTLSGSLVSTSLHRISGGLSGLRTASASRRLVSTVSGQASQSQLLLSIADLPGSDMPGAGLDSQPPSDSGIILSEVPSVDMFGLTATQRVYGEDPSRMNPSSQTACKADATGPISKIGSTLTAAAMMHAYTLGTGSRSGQISMLSRISPQMQANQPSPCGGQLQQINVQVQMQQHAQRGSRHETNQGSRRCSSMDVPTLGQAGHTTGLHAAYGLQRAAPEHVKPSTVWHEVRVKRYRDPMAQSDLLLVIQTDVSDRVEAEQRLARLLQAEQAMLEQIFPRHVMEAMAAAATQDSSEGSRSSSRSLAGSEFGSWRAMTDGGKRKGHNRSKGSCDGSGGDSADEDEGVKATGMVKWLSRIRDKVQLATAHEQVRGKVLSHIMCWCVQEAPCNSIINLTCMTMHKSKYTDDATPTFAALSWPTTPSCQQ